MRRNFVIAVIAAAATFITLQFTIGPRYGGYYGWWGTGNHWHRPYYGPPPGYYDRYPYDGRYDRWYGPYERERYKEKRIPSDSLSY